MKRLLLAIMIIVLGITTACSTALSTGDRINDNDHAFLIQSVQIIEKIDNDIAPEGESYLVIKYQIENLQSSNDSPRQWTNNITLEVEEKYYNPTSIESLDNELWDTNLLGLEKKSGYIAFTVPEDISNYTLTFTFPTSNTEAIYGLSAVDKRINANVDWVLDKLGKTENTLKLPLFSCLAYSYDIRYLGVVLVPREEVSQLFEETKGLSEDAKRAVIENYFIANGHCCLE